MLYYISFSFYSNPGAVVVGGIDPCSRYDVKLVLGSGELLLASLGPYYEAVPEQDLARVGLEDGEQLHRPQLAADVTAAQTNASTLSLGWGALCALSMSVYYRQVATLLSTTSVHIQQQ